MRDWAVAQWQHLLTRLAAGAGTILCDIPELRGRVPGCARVCPQAHGEHVADKHHVDQGAAVVQLG